MVLSALDVIRLALTTLFPTNGPGALPHPGGVPESLRLGISPGRLRALGWFRPGPGGCQKFFYRGSIAEDLRVFCLQTRICRAPHADACGGVVFRVGVILCIYVSL